MIFRFLMSIILGVILMLGSAYTFAQTKTLQEVIDKYCRKDCIDAEELTEIAKKAANSYKVDFRAILAIVHVESKYHIKAKNGSSVGLSQVLLYYHRKKFRGKDYFDPEDNIFAGMKVFSDCFKRVKGNYPRAFVCYNGGGDKNYRTKAMNAYGEMKNLKHTEVESDPLGFYIAKKGF